MSAHRATELRTRARSMLTFRSVTYVQPFGYQTARATHEQSAIPPVILSQIPSSSPRHTYIESAGLKPIQPEWKNFQNLRLIREGISIEPNILTGLL